MDTLIIPQSDQEPNCSRSGGIYRWRQLSTGKKYIGSTKNLRTRKIQHVTTLNNNSHANCHLLNAWNKYGKDDFVFEILEVIGDESELRKKEQWYLDTMIEYGVDFNIRLDANHEGEGSRFSEETRRRMSEAHKGLKRKPFSEDHRENLGKAKRGRPISEEHKKHISDAQKGVKKKPFSEEQKRRRPKPPGFAGMKHSDETKAKMSVWQKGKKKNRAEK
jgi:group I intron endonuclease